MNEGVVVLRAASMQLEPHRIEGLPSSFFYIPDFITAEEEQALLKQINSGRWIQLSHRRLQVHPAQLTTKNVLLTDKTLPPWLLDPLEARFDGLQLFAGTLHGKMNHVLINEYQPGQGIMPHEDGDAYAPVTVTLSLGSTTVLNIFEKKDQHRKGPRWRILQEQRSLLVTRGDAYANGLLHGIEEVEIDEHLSPDAICNWPLLGECSRFADGKQARGTRVSLTCRDVLKVSKLGNRLLGLGKR